MLVVNLIIGLGIFLFGMMQLEQGIQSLNSNWIKVWLKNNTRHRLHSVMTGTIVTAIVQSSSMISLIVLAFASAQLMPLSNAIGVLLGANLGTTISGWIVATLGFKLDLEAIAVPAIGLGGMLQVFADQQKKLKAIGMLIFGLGLLLFGLSMMKEAVAVIPETFNVERLKHFNAISFLVLGTVLTAVIQSSSATMMIALTALDTGMISLAGAAALVIGADLGTTSTTALGSLKGSPIKRQLALAHFSFNLVTNTLAFLILLPILPQLMQWLSIADPLYSLVAFHSFFNIFGLFIFIPILPQFTHWISNRFASTSEPTSTLACVPATVPEAAISACHAHVNTILAKALAINLRNLRIEKALQLNHFATQWLARNNPTDKTFEQRYESLKQLEGDLLQYVSSVQSQEISAKDSLRLTQLLNCARDAVYAVKTLKDIRTNLFDLRHTPTSALHAYVEKYQTGLKPFYHQLILLLASDHPRSYVAEQLQLLAQQNEQLHRQLHDDIQQASSQGIIAGEQLSTLFNVNREIWHANNSLLSAADHWFDNHTD